MNNKKKYGHQFWLSGESEWFSVYNFISKTYIVRLNVFIPSIIRHTARWCWCNLSVCRIYHWKSNPLLANSIQCTTLLELKSSSTGKFRSGRTNVDPWLPITCAFEVEVDALTGEWSSRTLCVTVSGEIELDGLWHSASTNWDGL